MDQLIKFRDAHKLTQQGLASLIGTSAGYLHDLENGRRKPSLALASRIERVTGIPRREIRPDIFALMSSNEVAE